MQLRPIAGLTLAVGLAVGLAGCISPPPVAEPVTESQAPVTEETAETDEGASSDGSDEAGQEEGASGGPVDGWPAEVPVPDGDVQQDASTGGQTVVLFGVDDAEAGEAYVAELEAAGFTQLEEGTTEIAGVVAEVFQGADHIVAVSTIESGEQVLLSVAIQSI